MTRSPVRRNGAHALKPLGTATRKEGQRLARLSNALREMGVQTPQTTYQQDTHNLRMPWLEGVSGREAILRPLSKAAAARDLHEVRRLLAVSMSPLTTLHRADPCGLSLEAFDPWRKITPRLSSSGPATDTVFRATSDIVAGLRVQTAKVLCPTTRPDNCVVHGDFHTGQILLDQESETIWLLDMEDLAAGPPESDLGNFAAHLATTPVTAAAGIREAYVFWTERVLETYLEITGKMPNCRLVHAYGAIALLRRGLKLREKTGVEAPLREIALTVKNILTLS